MHVYCLHSGLKRSDIVKEIFDVCLVVIGIKDVWKVEPHLHNGCHTIFKIQYPFCGYT